MDGLMFDTERLARDAWRRAMADHGCTLEDDVFVRGVGRTLPETCAIFVEVLGPEVPIHDIAQAKARYMAELLRPGPPLKPGLPILLEGLAQSALPLAVASSTACAEVDRRLVQTGIRRHFAAIAGGDEVTHGKPAPDLFLLAAERLGAGPAGCVVLEDSAPGITAAAAAGMTPIMVPDLLEPTPEIRALAAAVVPTLAEALEFIRGRQGHRAGCVQRTRRHQPG
jgi:HAD superfamily hydrolase (TIGR01509 family)